jgi:hypothetical protein
VNGDEGFVDRVRGVEQVVQPRGDLVVSRQRDARLNLVAVQRGQGRGDLGELVVVVDRGLVVRVPWKPGQEPVQLPPRPLPLEVIEKIPPALEQVELDFSTEPVEKLYAALESARGVERLRVLVRRAGVGDFPSSTSASSVSGRKPNLRITSIRNASSTW